jgi:hypothetical protein
VLWVAFARDNRANDTLASEAGDVAKRLGSLDVHLQECLLHVEDMRGAMLKELGTMA